MMAKHKPQLIFLLRRFGGSYVKTFDEKCLDIHLEAFATFRAPDGTVHFLLSRADAKLLVRRINQCLEETK